MDPLKRKQMLDEYQESLKSKSLDELHEIEKEIMAEADKAFEETKNRTLTLPNDAEQYRTMAEGIRLIINKISATWQDAVILIGIHDFWNPMERPKEVSYIMLDNTLRVLGERQFTGYSEWAATVAINKYFEPIREEYESITDAVYEVAGRHNAVLNQIKLLSPVEDIPDEIAVEQ